MLNELSIFQFPAELKKLELEMADKVIAISKANFELQKLKSKVIAAIDTQKYKNSEIRDNFCTLALAENEDYVKMYTEVAELEHDLRILKVNHAEMRRIYRILENEYQAHGTRTFGEVVLDG